MIVGKPDPMERKNISKRNRRTKRTVTNEDSSAKSNRAIEVLASKYVLAAVAAGELVLTYGPNTVSRARDLTHIEAF